MNIKWTKKDGSKIRIRDMDDKHLINTIKMIHRTARNTRDIWLSQFPCFQGDMAQMYAEQEWDNLNEMHEDDFAIQTYPILEFLRKEADKRKLKY